MHIALDIREALRTKRTGKGQWSRGFIEELLTRDMAYTLIGDEPVPDEWRKRARDVLLFRTGISWHWHTFRSLLGRKDIDLYVSPTSYIVPALLHGAKQCIPIVHDMIAFRREPHESRATFIERCTLRRAIEFAPHICTNSEATKRDLLFHYPSLDPDHITAIQAGPSEENPSLATPDGKTILCIGTLCPRKNQERLMRAFLLLPEHIKSQYELLLVGGRGWNDDTIVQLVRKSPGVRWLDHVSDEEYHRLLQTCTVLAFPSLSEGFGLQVLDALQRGIPVLTSDRGSLAEVAGDAALRVDPDSVDSIAQGLLEILSNEHLQATLREKGPMQAKQFSWQKTVNLFLDVLKGITMTSCSATNASASR